MIAGILLFHLVIGFALLAGAGAVKRFAVPAAMAPMVAAGLATVVLWPGVLDGRPTRSSTSWVPGLGLSIDLRVDAVSLVMMLLVSGVGAAVVVYSAGYFTRSAETSRTLGLLVLFAGSMLGVVTADHVIVFYVFWELTSVTSWLLIGQRHTDPEARSAAMHALLVTASGGLALLAGLVLLAQRAGSWSLEQILDAPPSGEATTIALVLVGVGIITKSAQYPTHAWLPGAMVAPTPISAYLHSATMVKAGIYLALRLGPVFAVTVPGWRATVVVIGLVTMISGGLRAIRQDDLKLLLAMGTVSQLGFLLVLVGVGLEEATVAGAVLLVAHGLFKSVLFLVVGIVDHQTGTRLRSEINSLGRGWVPVRICAVVSAASMAGLPPLVGFIAKEGAYETFLHEGAPGLIVLAGLVTGSVLTVAYSARLAEVFLRRPVAGAEAARPPALSMVVPVTMLTGLTIVTGLWPSGPLQTLVGGVASDARSGATTVSLSLWHGVNAALVLSVSTVTIGVVLYAFLDRFNRVTGVLTPPRSGLDGFHAVVRGVNVAAHAVTGRVQTGSLPAYASVIVSVVLVVPGLLLVAGLGRVDLPVPNGANVLVVLVAALVGLATVTAVVRRRFAAVVLLGAVGYAMAGVFVAQGAPDLALTQFTIETLSIVAFMLVLRRLPGRFSSRPAGGGRWLRLMVSSAAAVAVFVLATTSIQTERTPEASIAAIDRSLPDADGRNVVNVTLVDFRGLDTLGEISVLVVAGLGVTALARVGRGPRRAGSTGAEVNDDTHEDRRVSELVP